MLVYKCDPIVKRLANDSETMERWLKECKEFFNLSTIQVYLKHNNFFDVFKFWGKSCNFKSTTEVLAYVLYEKCGIDFTKYMTQEQLHEIKNMDGGLSLSLIETDEEK